MPAAPPAYTLLPFGAMLLAIAALPLLFKHHWERFYHWWALGLGTASVADTVIARNGMGRMLEAAHEYVSFIAMVGSLFIVVGGIHITVTGQARPLVNVVFLALASLLSNIIGTTGASMLLIRPWIRMNKRRITGFHVVFFIFLVSNVSGCLTPLGDPPLFLGFLKGVPFWWVLENCWKPWAAGVVLLLGIFFVFDARNFVQTPRDLREEDTAHETWRLRGNHNLIFLGIILCSFFVKRPVFLREAIMIAAAVASYFCTNRDIHKANDFSFEPIREVAWLFFGIFGTMIPALDYLHAHAASLGVHSELQFYWSTGLLSGVLDNAPTYLAFLAAAFGLSGLDMEADMGEFVARQGHTLMAISIGAVFFGAMTYIGNGPNFMVKAIAERAKVKTPGFFGYILFYSIPLLLPVLFVIGILFLSRWRIL